MKKLKKILLFLSVGLILSAPLMGLLPVIGSFTNNAKAATLSNDAPYNETQSYLLSRALLRCVDALSNSASYSAEGARDLNFPSSTDEGREVFIGYLDRSGDGKSRCTESYWIQSALEIWDFNDGNYSSTGEALLCAAGFKRANDKPFPGQSFGDCATGAGPFERDDTDPRSPTEQFIRTLNKEYYGRDSNTLPGLSEAGKYWYYLRSYETFCADNTNQTVKDFGGGDEEEGNDRLDQDPDRTSVPVIQDGYGVTDIVFLNKAGYSPSKEHYTRANDDGRGGVNWTCGYMLDQLRVSGRAEAYAAELKAKGIAAPEAGDGTSLNSSTADVEVACVQDSVDLSAFVQLDILTNALDWITCQVLTGFIGIANQLEDVIVGMLCINESDIFDGAQMTCSDDRGDQSTRDGFYNAWNGFRILALAFIAVAGLIMVISQAMGFDFIDAYTVKKVLPRILIAGIAISLSWPLMSFLVSLSNALGIGIRGLIYAPFEAANVDQIVIGGGAGAVGAILATASFAILGALGMLSFIATALIAIVIAFFVLVFRQILVMFLVIVAPIAIAMYVLPNTEKYWKIWWEWFFKALMAFPIITGMIAVGHVFAAVSSQKDGALADYIAFVAYFAPYFLIPAAFRFAGGALSTIGGFTNDRSRGAFDRLSKFRQNKAASNIQAIQENRRFNPRANGVFGKVNRGLNSALSSAADPVSTAKIYGGSALRKAGYDNSIGKGVLGQIDDSKFASTQKATELLMQKQLNDQALRSIMGLEHATPQNIRAEAARLSNSDDVNSRIAGNQLSAVATSLATSLSSDPEMGRANLQAAAGLALAQHGFADPDDVASLGNKLGGVENGFANMIVGQAQMNSARAGRSDFKPGYSVRLGPGGQFEGTTDFNTRDDDIGVKGGQLTKDQQEQLGRSRAAMVQRLKGLGTYEMQQAKPQTIKGLALGYETMLSSAPGKYEFIDDRGQTASYEFSEADQKRVLDQFANMKSGHSGANADQIAEIDKILKNSGRMADVEGLMMRQSGDASDPHEDGRIPKS